jgi:hypothetical protein
MPLKEESMELQDARTDWRNMTTDERQAIADDIAMRETLRIAREREERKLRAIALVNDSRIWDIPMLHQFICKINALAKRHGCLDKIPLTPFPSRQDFLIATMPILEEHGVPREEIEMIFDIDRQLEATRTDA